MKSFVLLVSALTIFGAVGCFKRSADSDLPAAPVVAEPQFVRHRVTQSGETLSSIAAIYTGNRNNWTKIRDANPQIQPTRMAIGSTVNIPAELVTKRNAIIQPIDPITTKNPAAKPFDGGNPAKKKAATKQAVAPEEKPVVKSVEKKAKPPEDLIQVKPSERTETSLPRLEAEEESVPPPPSGVGVVQETAPDDDPVAAAASTSTTIPQATDRIDPAPDREREKLLDELLSK